MPLEVKRSRWTKWQERTQGSAVPSTPSSATVQTLFGGVPQPAATPADPSDVIGNTYFYSKQFFQKYFLVWYWAAYVLLNFIGFDFFVSLFTALVCMTIGCLTFGLARSIDTAVKANRAKLNAKFQQSSFGAPPSVAQQQSLTPAWNPQANIPTAVINAGPTDPFVGNLVLGIYHLENCDWVNRISTKNRVGFSTASEAVSHGFKPCRICSPA